jgi:hypothetical protein
MNCIIKYVGVFLKFNGFTLGFWAKRRFQLSKNNELCTTMFLRRIYVAGNNIRYFGLRVKCPIFVFDFNQIWIFSTYFHKSP